MMPEQGELLSQAEESLRAARTLLMAGHPGFAASRAYYTMFYVAEAFLLGKDMAFSKHSAVHSAFRQYFVKVGEVPQRFGGYLTRGMELRHAGDYGPSGSVSRDQGLEQIARAEEFLELAKQLIGPIPEPVEEKE